MDEQILISDSERLAEIIEWVIKTEGEIDFYETEDLDWCWNAKVIRLADANYLSVAYYGGSERSSLFLIEGNGITDAKKYCRYIAKEVFEMSYTEPGSNLYFDKTSDGWKKLMVGIKGLSLKKVLSKTKGA